MEQTQSIVFDRPKLSRLRHAYEKARKEGEETFLFEDREYVTDYARYLIEYLAHKLREGGSVVRNPPS